MMLVDMSVDATLILLLGFILLAFGRRLPAASKHVLCATALSLIVLLPILDQLPSAARPALFTVTVAPASNLLGGRAATMAWISVVWACGFGVVLLRFVSGIGYLAWQTRRSSKPVLEFATPGIDIRFGDVATPLMWGWSRPTILLPVCFPGWTPEQRKAAIKHEIAHIERRDSWVALIVTAAEAIYWFHPLVWWMSRKLTEQREFAADDRVLATGIDAAQYATFLVSTARAMPSQFLFGCSMLAGSLRSRVEHLLRSGRAAQSLRLRLLTACGVATLVACALALPKDQVYTIGGDVSAPVVIQKVGPEYTTNARRDKTQGSVLLSLVIGKNGNPQNVRVHRSLTPDLDQQAIRAVSLWRFKPATKEGRPVSVQAKIEVNFRLL